MSNLGEKRKFSNSSFAGQVHELQAKLEETQIRLQESDIMNPNLCNNQPEEVPPVLQFKLDPESLSLIQEEAKNSQNSISQVLASDFDRLHYVFSATKPLAPSGQITPNARRSFGEDKGARIYIAKPMTYSKEFRSRAMIRKIHDLISSFPILPQK